MRQLHDDFVFDSSWIIYKLSDDYDAKRYHRVGFMSIITGIMPLDSVRCQVIKCSPGSTLFHIANTQLDSKR